jgi:hypothetical protein
MTENSTFSSSGVDAISQSIPVSLDADQLGSASQFEEYYEIERTAGLIFDGGWKRVRRCPLFTLLILSWLSDVTADCAPIPRRAPP